MAVVLSGRTCSVWNCEGCVRRRLCLIGLFLVVGSWVVAQEQTPTQTQGGAPVVQVPGSVPQVGKESTPAVVTTTVPSPASPPHWPEQVMWSIAMSYMMQFLKKQAWFPILTPQTDKRIQALYGFIVAAGTAAGIHLAVQGSVLDGSGLSISITGLTLDAIKDVGFQWMSQQVAYDKIVKELKVA